MQNLKTSRKILFLRLSSLGDVILSSSALGARPLEGDEVHWVVSKEYEVLLKGHPRIRRLWAFDRKTGFEGWIRLCEALWAEGYDEIIDLHSSLRTRLLSLVFRAWSIGRPMSSTRPRFRRIRKDRIRLWSYFLWKGLWPQAWRPRPMVERFSLLAGGTGQERPDLRHLLDERQSELPVLKYPYLCVMPSSLWEGKRWPVESYLECLKSLPYLPVILGTASDRESVQLIEALKRDGVDFVSGVGVWNLRQVAQVLAGSAGYFGNDTGLAHLAESLGVPAYMIFGPTVPDMGFGPWQENSRAIGASLWCRPCGKDGRFCFRTRDRYACLKGVLPQQVTREISERIKVHVRE